LEANSEIISHIKITEISGGDVFSLGATEFYITGDVISNYKGSVKPKELINFTVISYTDQFNRIVVGMEYIIFLKKTDWIIKSEKENNINSYTIADRWLGIQSYYEDLNNYLSKN